MKKIILVIAAIGTIATANAQHSNWHALSNDSTSVTLNVQIDDAIEMTPEGTTTISSPQFNINDLMPGTTLYLNYQNFRVWSNRSYNVNYNVSGTTPGASITIPNLTWDGDGGNILSNGDNANIPLDHVHMTTTIGNSVDGTATVTNDGQSYVVTAAGPAVIPPALTPLALSGPVISNCRPAGGHTVGGTGWGYFGIKYYLTNPEYAVVGGNYTCTITVVASQE